MVSKNKTTHVRIYKKDLDDIKLKFPDVRMPDFFRMAVKTNPFMQAEAILRKNAKTKKK